MPGAVLPTGGPTLLLCPALKRLPITAEGAVTTCLWFPKFSWTSGTYCFWGFFACLLCCPLWCVVIVSPSSPGPCQNWWRKKWTRWPEEQLLSGGKRLALKNGTCLSAYSWWQILLLTNRANPLQEFEWQYRKFYRVELDSDKFYLKTLIMSISGLTCRKL